MDKETTATATPGKTQEDQAGAISFGKLPTDHMFIAEYKNGAWNKGELKRFQRISLSPFALCFHYGQSVFEGMKAFRMNDGRVQVFRMKKHSERLNTSLERMCMPSIPLELFSDAITQVVKADQQHIGTDEDSSLYIRPLVIASEEKLGVKVSDEYLFIIMCTPGRKYFSNPIKVKVEVNFTRAAEGGTGFTKCSGNYGGAFYPTHLARLQGYDQVIWTDAYRHEFIEELGVMNMVFIVDGKIITPALSGTILDGITRDSILTMARKNKIEVEERPVSVEEVIQFFESGKRVEAFGAGTAAIVAPIEQIDIGGKKFNPYIAADALMFTFKKELNDIWRGHQPDAFGWNHVI
jgi:branched-chain amino acid aminotransferase